MVCISLCDSQESITACRLTTDDFGQDFTAIPHHFCTVPQSAAIDMEAVRQTRAVGRCPTLAESAHRSAVQGLADLLRQVVPQLEGQNDL